MLRLARPLPSRHIQQQLILGRCKLMSSASSSSGTYAEAITALNTLQSNASVIEAIRRSGGKLNDFAIPEMVEYLERVGWKVDDLNRVNVIHITGTKGKGSTSAFVDSLIRSTPLNDGGHRRPVVGLYTSPHLVQVRERIRLDGQPISEHLFAKYFWQVWNKLEQNDNRKHPEMTPLRPVYFRYMTILAFHVFLSLNVRCSIFEVGIGGRYDSTNIVPKPVATGITTLGLDHTALLGNTIAEIAYQKAGIFKQGCEAVSVEQSDEAIKVIEEEAKKVGTSSYRTLPAAITSPASQTPLGIPGAHQISNAQLAIELYRILMRSFSAKDSFVTTGTPSIGPSELTEVEKIGLKNASWPGRCQIVPDRDHSMVWFLDGAHTTESLQSCAKWFVTASLADSNAEKPIKRTLIFNTTHDRKSEELLSGMMSAIAGELDRGSQSPVEDNAFIEGAIFCTNTTYKDGRSSGDLTAVVGEVSLEPQKRMQEAWKKLHPESKTSIVSSIEEAIEEAERQGSSQILVCGSLHLVGGVMSHLKEAGLLDESLNALY